MSKEIAKMIVKRLYTPIEGPTLLAMNHIKKLEDMGLKNLSVPMWALIEDAFVEGYNAAKNESRSN